MTTLSPRRNRGEHELIFRMENCSSNRGHSRDYRLSYVFENSAWYTTEPEKNSNWLTPALELG